VTEQILAEREIEYFVKDWKLIPSAGGKFEVTVNDELVFSKKALGRHAEEGEVRSAILKVLDTLRPPDFKFPKDDDD
jgi:selT/selW/selH-like putative selenoprotein